MGDMVILVIMAGIIVWASLPSSQRYEDFTGSQRSLLELYLPNRRPTRIGLRFVIGSLLELLWNIGISEESVSSL